MDFDPYAYLSLFQKESMTCQGPHQSCECIERRLYEAEKRVCELQAEVERLTGMVAIMDDMASQKNDLARDLAMATENWERCVKERDEARAEVERIAQLAESLTLELSEEEKDGVLAAVDEFVKRRREGKP